MTQRKFFKIVRGIKLYGIYNYICIAFTEKRQFRGRHLLPENHRFEIVPVIDFSITYKDINDLIAINCKCFLSN